MAQLLRMRALAGGALALALTAGGAGCAPTSGETLFNDEIGAAVPPAATVSAAPPVAAPPLPDPAAKDRYAPGPADAALEDAPTKEDMSLLDDAQGAGAETPYDLADTLPEAEWQHLLSADLDALEAKGDLFLEASFGLYAKIQGASDGGQTLDRPAVDQGLEDARARYEELTAAANVLRADLDRADVRTFLPGRGSEDRDAVERAAAVLAAAPPQKQLLVYDPASPAALTALLFGGQVPPPGSGDGRLPKTQQDAALLLDRLRRLTGELAFLSSTVTGWIHDSGTESAQISGSYAAPQQPPAPPGHH